MLEQGVIHTIEENRNIFEPHADKLDAAFVRLNMLSNQNSTVNHEEILSDSEADIDNDAGQIPVQLNSSGPSSTHHFPPDDEINLLIRSLNQQRKIFDF